jgi:hypothetical protein
MKERQGHLTSFAGIWILEGDRVDRQQFVQGFLDGDRSSEPAISNTGLF